MKIYDSAAIIFLASRSVICVNRLLSRVRSQIHCLDLLPQYQYRPSNFIRNDDVMVYGPGITKYWVLVSMIYHTMFVLKGQEPVHVRHVQIFPERLPLVK